MAAIDPGSVKTRTAHALLRKCTERRFCAKSGSAHHASICEIHRRIQAIDVIEAVYPILAKC
jgi:hypothetical protein